MKKIFSIIIALLLLSGLLSAADKTDNTITFKTIKDKTIHVIGTEKGFTIPEYKGKIMFVEFWGTHCPPCLMAIPHYIELTKKYKDQLAMLAIEVQSTPKEKLKAFAAAKGMNYDVVDYKSGYPFVEYITQRAGWTGSIPLLLILDQEGVVQIVQPGFIPAESLEQVVKEMIAQKNKAPAAKTEDNSSKN